MLEANDALAAVFGYRSREDMLDQHLIFTQHYDNLEERERFLRQLRSKGNVSGFEALFRRVNGERIWGRVSATLFEDQGYIQGVFEDITQIKRTQEALRASEQRFRSFVENASDIVFALTPEGEFTYISPNWLERMGEASEDAVGKHFAPYVVDEDVPLCAAFLEKVLTTDQNPGTVDYRVRRVDGEIRWHTATGSALKDDRGNTNGFVGIARDVTEQKRAAENLQERLRYEEALQNISRVLLSVQDQDDAMSLALTYLLEVSGSSHVHLFENIRDDKGALFMKHRYEACVEGVTSALGGPGTETAAYEPAFSRWAEEMDANRIIQGHLRDLPEKEREAIECDGTRSLLLMPIHIESSWFGFIGYQETRVERSWSDENVRLLQVAAEMIGAYILRKRVETELRESEEKFRILFETIPVGISITDRSGALLSTNQISSEYLGIGPDEHNRRSLYDEDWLVVDGSGQPMQPEEFPGIRAINNAERVEHVLMGVQRPDGETSWLTVNAQPLNIGEYGAVISYADITPQMNYQRELNDQKKWLEGVFGSVPNGLITIDTETRITASNPAFRRMVDLSEEELHGRSFVEFVAPDDLETTMQHYKLGLQQGQSLPYEIHLRKLDGALIPVEIHATSILDDKGEAVGRVAVVMDLTSREEARQLLAESNLNLRMAQRIASVGNWTFNPETSVTFWSEQAFRIFGRPPKEGPPTLEEHRTYYSRNVWELFEEAAHRAVEQGVPYDLELPGRRQNGEPFWVRTICEPSRERGPKGHYLRGTMQDITDRKQAQQELAAREERYRALTEQTTDAIYLTDSSGKLLEVNQAAVEMTGYERHELLKMYVYDLEQSLDAVQVRQALESFEPGSSRSLNGQHKKKDGTLLPVEVNIRCFATPEGLRFLSSARDITERQRMEEERRALEHRVAESQRADSLGVLAGGIAHDFNNLLVGVLGNAELVEEELEEDSQAHELMDEIKSAAQRAADLSLQMLAYSGKGRFHVQDVNLNDLVHEIVQLMQSSLPANISLNQALSESISLVRADATQIRQIIMNLLTNAVEAVEERGGSIQVKTGMRMYSEAELKDGVLAEQFKPGEYVTLEIEDSGVGFPQEDRVRLFEPFYSTKFTGRGLGLAAVQGIVRGHEGTILVSSSPGKGASFKILLPPAKAALAGEAKTTATGSTGKRELTGTVLVVDDEAAVRSVAQRMLHRLGVKTLQAEGGQAAIDLYRRRGDEIDCVLLVMTMPGMDGEAVFKKLHELDEDVNVVMTSGYNEQEIINHFRGLPLTGFIQKPFRMASLFDVLSGPLGQKENSASR